MADAYRVLNVSPTASHQEIRSAYVELACQHHPCNSERKVLNPSANHTQFRLVAEAYLLVGDDLHRELYDMIKSSSPLNKPAYRPNLDGFNSQVRLAQPTRRSRAFSELTIDLRVGLPPELRALLSELDPIKLFNRVVNQIDRERKLKQNSTTEIPTTSVRLSPSLTSINPLLGSANLSSKSKYLSPLHCFLDEGKIQRSRSPPKTNTTREEVMNKQQRLLNLASKPGILRDESKNQLRPPSSNLTEALKRDPMDSYRRINLEFLVDPIISRGHSRNSSYLSNVATSTSAGSSQKNRSRRVSFSNDVIETDELKQAREVVRSFKSEIARKSSKPVLPTSNSPHPGCEPNGGMREVNRPGVSATPRKTSPPSSYNVKNGEFFSDQSLYRDPDRRSINSFPQEKQPILLEKATRYRSNLDYGDKEYYDPVAASATTTGYLPKYREESIDRRNGIHSNLDTPTVPPFVDRKYEQPRSASRSPRRDAN